MDSTTQSDLSQNNTAPVAPLAPAPATGEGFSVPTAPVPSVDLAPAVPSASSAPVPTPDPAVASTPVDFVAVNSAPSASTSPSPAPVAPPVTTSAPSADLTPVSNPAVLSQPASPAPVLTEAPVGVAINPVAPAVAEPASVPASAPTPLSIQSTPDPILNTNLDASNPAPVSTAIDPLAPPSREIILPHRDNSSTSPSPEVSSTVAQENPITSDSSVVNYTTPEINLPSEAVAEVVDSGSLLGTIGNTPEPVTSANQEASIETTSSAPENDFAIKTAPQPAGVDDSMLKDLSESLSEFAEQVASGEVSLDETVASANEVSSDLGIDYQDSQKTPSVSQKNALSGDDEFNAFISGQNEKTVTENDKISVSNDAPTETGLENISLADSELSSPYQSNTDLVNSVSDEAMAQASAELENKEIQQPVVLSTPSPASKSPIVAILATALVTSAIWLAIYFLLVK